MKNFSEEQILDYLMTSEFDDPLSPEDLKFLLRKFRNFYRVAACSIDSYRDRMDYAVKESKAKMEEADNKVHKINIENEELINRIEGLLNRKLTLKERLKGKIIEGK